MSHPARYVMIGGFLGAGKSTAMGRLARRLTDEGLSVGLITNDQGRGLVDTLNLRSQGHAVEEIAGGCFCCRFESLLEAAGRLSVSSRPDIFLAEPVGSCTDLVATVSYPLRRIYGEDFAISPFSVLVDPIRARRVLGLDTSRQFSPKVNYVYRKQLEEADLIVVNKKDLLGGGELEELRSALAGEFPGKPILDVSARTGDGLDSWFDAILHAETAGGDVMDIDYDLYAEGEARLGWLNGTIRLSAPWSVDGNGLLRDLAEQLGRRLEGAGATIAHLKMTLTPDGGSPSEIGLVSLVREGMLPEIGQGLSAPVDRGEIVINLRAESPPEVLRQTLEDHLDEISGPSAATGVDLVLEHVECFRPGRPVPTHRVDRAS